ncbi:hypothetical protein [Klebsiella pneumoniae]|uniref:hypothetical protein n=1 Tax=Klebsiella pneumoniae TaxID=573 RepID=UPI001F4E4916|nr:hypothetical protein [Klebsiella pneumoniae]MCH9348880.1 hypothetical protein [Klebsiella pneumoniae]MCH9439066.1 hypothetical protein [Klebsiella pneumoniae]MCH9465515.1 hypothetical protein [Klebsiella pneumoniae]MCH9471034.1 hypothetical protein [Klebsiella pneumoniae]MCH9476777.1 hypothetical protein [Klebsiella pneumoniae]
MTNITELAQNLKAAAIDAKELAIIARYSKGRAAAEKFYALANPNNVIALVEALEKAKGMEAYWKVQCRGITDHCEVLQARIAELEPRTVKLPAERFCPAEYAGSQLWSETEVWNKAITACADALRADGIKVEAG